MRFLSRLLLAALVTLGACATIDSGPPLLRGNVDAPPPAMATADDSLLTYAVWVWQDMRLADGTQLAPGAPDRYTLEFRPGGTVNVRADCNRGSGQYTQNGAQLTFGPIALTKMMCPPGSRDTDFLKALSAVSEQSLRGTDLVLTLRGDAGSIRFSPPRR